VPAEGELSVPSSVFAHVLKYGQLHTQRFASELMKQYRKEQELMLGALHEFGMHRTREHLGSASGKQQLLHQGRSEPSSWLAQQRKNVSLLIFVCVTCSFTFWFLFSLARHFDGENGKGCISGFKA
jgi:hypothetical protein